VKQLWSRIPADFKYLAVWAALVFLLPRIVFGVFYVLSPDPHHDPFLGWMGGGR